MARAWMVLGGLAARCLSALAVAAGCATAQTASAPPSAPSAPVLPSHAADTSRAWLVADDASKTVTVALQVTRLPDGSALINGRRAGRLQVVVPLNWTVQWDWRNADSTSPHSLVVMVEREKLPTEGGRPAFTNAMTRQVTAGLTAGQGDRTTFTAEEAGWFWLLCGVPGHAIAGEYLGLRVDPEAKTASVKEK
jgi:hypothetical protein